MKYSENLDKRKSICLENQGHSMEETAIGLTPVTRNLSCRQAGKGNKRGADTKSQQNIKASGFS